MVTSVRRLSGLGRILPIVGAIACSPAGVKPTTPVRDAGPADVPVVTDATDAPMEVRTVRDSMPLPEVAPPAVVEAGPPPLTDFPTDPVIGDPAVPPDASTIFGGTPRTGGMPCIVSPEPGTLMPRNWLRPRFEIQRAADENLFEIRLSVTSFANPLVVYTTQPTYTLEAELWSRLRISVNEQPITVSVRAATLSSTGTVQNPPSEAATSTFTIAPVDAPGKIVYWAIPNGSSDGILRGFGIGEEGVANVLTGPQVMTPARATNDGCVGCHAATPDGLSVGFVFGPLNNNRMGMQSYFDSIADIRQASRGAVPSYVTAGALATVRTLRGVPTYSRAHWVDGDRIVLLTDAAGRGDLLWVQLDADAAQGVIARNGDTRPAIEPSFSNDGTRIVYVSGQSLTDGRLGNGPADLFVVPYGDRMGGDATRLAGASESTHTEYYPAFSRNDAYVAFSRISGNGNSYSNPQAEVFVVPSSGGTALRFGANDPPACQTSVRSPGVTNSWPKWSPAVTRAANGTSYYWMTFSSTRQSRPQLYVAPMTVDSAGTVNVAYPALYLWNQPAADNNHTPSWDDYELPPIIVN